MKKDFVFNFIYSENEEDFESLVTTYLVNKINEKFDTNVLEEGLKGDLKNV